MPIRRRMHWAWLWRLWQTAWVRSGLPNCVHKLEKRHQDSMRECNKVHWNSHIGPKVFCLVFKQGLSWDIPNVGQRQESYLSSRTISRSRTILQDQAMGFSNRLLQPIVYAVCYRSPWPFVPNRLFCSGHQVLRGKRVYQCAHTEPQPLASEPAKA